MTSGLKNYFQALEETKKNLDPPVGLSNYNASSRANVEIIKQNNVIIQMLRKISLESCIDLNASSFERSIVILVESPRLIHTSI